MNQLAASPFSRGEGVVFSVLATLALASFCACNTTKKPLPSAPKLTYNAYGFSLQLPKNVRVSELGEPLKSPLSFQKGKIMATTEPGHPALTLTWWTDATMPGSSAQELETQISKLLKTRTAKTLQFFDPNFMGEELTWKSDAAHDIHLITWTFTGAPTDGNSGMMYGATALVYCPKTHRLFEFDVLGAGPQVKDEIARQDVQYISSLRCHPE